MDRVTDATDRQTFVTGAGCLPLLEHMHPTSAGWVAREIIAPLNESPVRRQPASNRRRHRRAPLEDFGRLLQPFKEYAGDRRNAAARARR